MAVLRHQSGHKTSSLTYSVIFLSPSAKLWYNCSIRPRPPPSKAFPKHQQLVGEQQAASPHNPQQMTPTQRAVSRQAVPQLNCSPPGARDHGSAMHCGAAEGQRAIHEGCNTSRYSVTAWHPQAIQCYTHRSRFSLVQLLVCALTALTPTS
jgi:hypothetical protein